MLQNKEYIPIKKMRHLHGYFFKDFFCDTERMVIKSHRGSSCFFVGHLTEYYNNEVTRKLLHNKPHFYANNRIYLMSVNEKRKV